MPLIIAGDRSGTGKTTITLALLSFLKQKGYAVQSFKVGPDYIDPMFHTAITGRPCRNLDPILTSETYLNSCFNHHCQDVSYAIIEGVMGLFDGIKIQQAKGDYSPDNYTSNYASTAHVARLLNIPVILVIDCSRLSGSVAAIAQGYRSLDPKINLAGIILNRVGSDRHLTLLKDALEPLNLPILGILHRQDAITIPDRHLGLIPTQELSELQSLFNQLAHLAAESFNWEQLLPLLQTSHNPQNSQTPHPSLPIKIAIARDRAFNFYYQDNLDILQKLGAELINWSPLEDKKLPENIQGLYFGGGFPEVFAQQLSENKTVIQSVRNAIQRGIPTYAECGGLMYLSEQIIDFSGQNYPMVGILPTTAIMGDRLTLGYRQATALENSLLINAGETLRGHEFHRSQLTIPPQSPLFSLESYHRNSLPTQEGWRRKSVHASYLHLHFGGFPTIAQKFLRHCLDFSECLG